MMKKYKKYMICTKARCDEVETIKTEFDTMFDDSNIVEKIEHELWNVMLN